MTDSTPSPADALEEIARDGGLNLSVGLSHMMGDRALYVGLLQRLGRSQEAVFDKFLAALNAENWSLAECQIHSFKSVAANIGAEALQQQAHTLEALVHRRSERTEYDRPLLAAQSLLAQLQKTLHAHFSRPKDAAAVAMTGPAAPPSQRASAAQLRSDMLDLLARDDAFAGDLLYAHEAVFKSLLGTHYVEFRDAVASFELAQAAQLLSDAATPPGPLNA
ncbi:Hpt domain-containing protein [Roseateles koreensis]|uniref:Hpt domain-containing protein n=1 Tax=Roseateles koreensis TaxID=2987526 RepID=A0ABT5KQG8_9BURK|nr:Hpt domain-containing protein [Roseateles koreensis]MDC8785159.1 Hpt domain-containing protein [Roseateles koreensis]